MENFREMSQALFYNFFSLLNLYDLLSSFHNSKPVNNDAMFNNTF